MHHIFTHLIVKQSDCYFFKQLLKRSMRQDAKRFDIEFVI